MCEWIDAFSVTVHVSDRAMHIYYHATPGLSAPKQHIGDQRLIYAEVEKYPHPLDGQLLRLYTTLTGKIAFRPKVTNEHTDEDSDSEKLSTYKSSDTFILVWPTQLDPALMTLFVCMCLCAGFRPRS